MPRPAAWWDEFYKSFLWIGSAAEKSEKVWKIIQLPALAILTALGLAGTLTEWAVAIKPYAPFLLGSAAMLVTWNAAIAWHKTSGPIIWIGPMEFDEERQVFDLPIKNVGTGHVGAYVYAVYLRDKLGKKNPRIGAEFHLPWKGFDSNEPMNLFGERHCLAEIIAIKRGPQSTPGSVFACLELMVAGSSHGSPPGAHLVALYPSEPVLLKDQEEVALTIRVDFYNWGAEGKCLKSKLKTFSIVPDETLGELYRIKSK
jgi:hypothetical protein